MSQVPAHLAERIRSEGARLAGERKQVTVLFCDAVNSMDLAEQLDPEHLRDLMDRLFLLVTNSVHRFEGTVDKFTGDGAMALFGAPIAHEDHARRACYAALAIRDGLLELAAQVKEEHSIELSLRQGLNSGEVVVGAIGEDLSLDYTAVGHTVGLAQRMESLAEPGAVCLSERTAKLAAGYLELEELGEREVKGSRKPVRVFRLRGVGAARGPLDVSRACGLSPLTGRERELESLEQALERALATEGCAVGVVGEPGVGKSRLCAEFAGRCRERGVAVFEARGQAHTKTVPFLPVLEMLRSYFGVSVRDPDKLARERIEERLRALSGRLSDELPLLFDFLGFADPEHPVERMNPEARRRRLLALVKGLVHAQSAEAPTVNVVEDLQWMDPASETFLGGLVEALPGARSLALVNFRPGYRAEWMGYSYYRQLALAPLDGEAAEQLAGELLGDDPSLAELTGLVTERAAGNPFFCEEIVNSLAEAGQLEGERGAYRLTGEEPKLDIPPTVQTVLAARIDRLAERPKQVVGAAAVIGREFEQRLLAEIVEASEDELDAALHELVQAEFCFEAELYPESIYAFKHPLSREVAYETQLGERRRGLHRAVAEAIQRLYAERLDERAALIAHHFEGAEEPLEAARWHAQAAEWAAKGEPAEALRHWCSVRELAGRVEESEETLALGLRARTQMLNLGWRVGISPEEAAACLAEGERLAERTGDLAAHVMLLFGGSLVAGTNQGELEQAIELSKQSTEIAERADRPELVLLAEGGLGYWLQLSSRFEESLKAVERALSAASEDAGVGAGLPFACPYAMASFQLSLTLFRLGRLEEAQLALERATELAHRHGDEEMLGFCKGTQSIRTRWLGLELDRALAQAREAVEVAERTGGDISRLIARNMLAWTHDARGEWPEAAAVGEEALALIEAQGVASSLRPLALTGYAEAQIGLGNAARAIEIAERAVDEAQLESGRVEGQIILAQALLARDGAAAAERVEETLAEVFAFCERTGERTFPPRALEARAELARLRGDDDAHRADLREAHRIYTEIGARGQADRLTPALA